MFHLIKVDMTELLADIKENFSKENASAVLQCHFNNVGRLSPAVLFKRASSTGVFLWIFYEYLFYRTLLSNCFRHKKKRISSVFVKVAQ